jgi:cytochrome c biogenesis factor
MTLIEKANQFLRILNEFATSEGYDSYADANKICQTLNIIDMAEVRNIVKLLENRGLVRAIWTMRDISVNISEEGVIVIESGYGLNSAFQHERPVTVHIDQSTTVHGNVDHSNLAVHSEGTKQNLSDSRTYEQVLDEMRQVINNDQTLSAEEKTDYATDVENLNRELSKNKPKKANVHTYIASLSGLASLSSLVLQLVQLLPPLF